MAFTTLPPTWFKLKHNNTDYSAFASPQGWRNPKTNELLVGITLSEETLKLYPRPDLDSIELEQNIIENQDVTVEQEIVEEVATEITTQEFTPVDEEPINESSDPVVEVKAKRKYVRKETKVVEKPAKRKYTKKVK